MDAQDLRALKVLLAVREDGSFAGAARRLGVTRAAVSRAIAQLEERLGARLARRTTRRVVLTDAALSLTARAALPLRQVEEALEAAREQHATLAGALRVAGSAAFGRDVLVPLLIAFREQHPEVALELSLADRVEDLVARPIDVAVRIGPLPDASLVARAAGKLPLVLVAAPALLRGRAAPGSLDRLSELPAVAFRVPETGRRYPWAFEQRGRTLLYEPAEVSLESDSIDAVAALVLRGAGASVLPRHLVSRELAAGQLVELLPGALAPGPSVSVCYAQRALMPKRVRAMVDFLARELPRALDEERALARAPGRRLARQR